MTYLKWLFFVIERLDHRPRKATHNRTFSPTLAMTSLNGIWPAECLCSVWGWCQVQASPLKFSLHNISKLKKTVLQGTAHLFQWESTEMMLLELARKWESVLDLCFRKTHGGKGKSKMGKWIPLPPKCSSRGSGRTPCSCLTRLHTQHILHIYIHQLFPNRLVFV